MPLIIPTVRELLLQTVAESASRLGLGSTLPPRSNLEALARAFVGPIYGAIARLSSVARDLFPDTAAGAQLERLASLDQVFRKPAAYASGSVIFSSSTAAVMPAGSMVRRSDGVEYSTTLEVAFFAGSAVAPVEAVLGGVAGNYDEGLELTLTSPVAGVSSTAVVESGGLTGGADRESDDALRDRLLLKRRTPPQGGALADYVLWALEVPGVTRAWSQRANPNPGDVGVPFVVDGDPGGLIPSPAKVAEVLAYIVPRAPAGANPVVFAPGVVEVDVEVTGLEPDTEAVRAAIEASLNDYFARTTEPGGTVALSQLSEAISLAAGESEHTLTDPVANVVLPTGSIARLGTLTFA